MKCKKNGFEKGMGCGKNVKRTRFWNVKGFEWKGSSCWMESQIMIMRLKGKPRQIMRLKGKPRHVGLFTLTMWASWGVGREGEDWTCGRATADSMQSGCHTRLAALAAAYHTRLAALAAAYHTRLAALAAAYHTRLAALAAAYHTTLQ
jgi:hypothetical protein